MTAQHKTKRMDTYGYMLLPGPAKWKKPERKGHGVWGHGVSPVVWNACNTRILPDRKQARDCQGLGVRADGQ